MNISQNESNAIANLRMPPHSLEAESSLLGALLLNNNSLGLIAGVVKAQDFYRHENQIIFKEIVELIDRNKAADVVTVYERLGSIGAADDVGGIAYLNTLAQFVPSASNIKRYAEIIQEKSILRRLIAAGDSIVAEAFSTKGSTPAEQLDRAEEKILQIGLRDTASHDDDDTMSSLIHRFNNMLLERSENPEKLLGVSTGFDDLDQITNGFKKGNLIVVAGRPSMGKTSIAMNFAENCAINEKLPVLVISLEMAKDELTTRMVGSVGRINQTGLIKGALEDHEWSRLAPTIETLEAAPIHIRDTTSGVNTISGIRSAARRAQHLYKQPLGMIVVDYLQMINGGDDSQNENRATEVGYVSRGLKQLAGELNCPVVALSQLNRGVENRPDKRPMMSDLRESGAIEQDADLILFVYRDKVYTKEACICPDEAEIIVAKQRNGATGTVRLKWEPEYTRFVNLRY